jgi:cysteinyl-tRNA synthetase
MTVRFFMLQSQYRSTLDFSNDALKAAQKGYKRLINGLRIIKNLEYVADDSIVIDEKQIAEIEKGIQGCYDGLNDDLNTAVTIAGLFNLVKKINQLYMGQVQTAQIGEATFNLLKEKFVLIIEGVLGIVEEQSTSVEAFAKGMLTLYKEHKEAKQYDKVDEIRGYFKANGLVIKDMKTRIDWAYEE